MNNWIRVRDRVPDIARGDYVLVYRNVSGGHGYITLGYVNTHGGWEEWPTSRHLNVTHWMPLPEPPRKLWVWTPYEHTTCTCGEELALPHDMQRVECPCGEVWMNLGQDGEPVIDGYTKELRIYYKWRTE